MIMGFKMERALMWLKMIVLLSANISVSLGQTVTVSMEPIYYSDPATSSATLTCDFSVDDGTYAFFNLEWKIDGTIVADFYNGATDPLYQNYCSSSSSCTITRTSDKSDFTISSLDMTRNKEIFSCLVTFQLGTERRNGEDSASLVVVVPTKTIVMSNGSSSETFTDGDPVNLSLDVAIHIFQCEVAGINPKATFTWTVGDEPLSSDSITESHDVDTGTGLTTSTSNATLTPSPNYNSNNLICKAVNYEGDPGVSFRLVLEVDNPCVRVECKNGGTCAIDTSDPSDPTKTKCICAPGYTGELCESVVKTGDFPLWAIIPIIIVAVIIGCIIIVVVYCFCCGGESCCCFNKQNCCCCCIEKKTGKDRIDGSDQSQTPMEQI